MSIDCGIFETSMKVGPQLEYDKLRKFRNKGISDLACNKNNGRFQNGRQRPLAILWYTL